MFDLDILYSNKTKAKEAIANSDFYNFICDDLITRAFRLQKLPQKILLIDPPIKTKIESSLSKKYTDASIIICFANQLSNLQEKFDLILYPFGMHWSVDVQFTLKNIYTRLKPEGVFIANFAGEGSLSSLQKKLFLLEDKFTNKHFPHISPFIKFEYMTPLLQQAGYQENIIDIEDIEIESETPLALMKSLQRYGESNVLKKRGGYSITPAMYRELRTKCEKPFIDYIRVISFICSPKRGTIKLRHK